MKQFTLGPTVLKITSLLLTSFATISLVAQTNVPNANSANWVAQGAQPAFVENKGQYIEKTTGVKQTVLFAAVNTGKIYFTQTGLVYELVKREDPTEEEKEEYEKMRRATSGRTEEEDEREGKIKVYHHTLVNMEWVGANTNATLVSENQTTEYWNYEDPMDPNRSINYAHGFRKLTYKNLYPGIDVEYVFHPERGVKYTILAQPGADLSLVKMKYSGATEMTLDASGNLVITTPHGRIKDHAPFTFYTNERTAINSSFTLNNDIVSFALSNYDQTKAVTIDPWTVTAFVPSYSPFEVGKDAANNVYVLGRNTTPNQIVEKYNSAGALQWTYNLTTQTTGYDSYVGDIAINPAGEVIVSKGLAVTPLLGTGDCKLTTGGVLVWNNGMSPLTYENWRVTYNCDFTQIINSGCGPSCCNGGRLDVLDPITGIESNFVIPNSAGDMICTAFGQNGYAYNINVNNSLICMDPANNFSVVYDIPVAFGLSDGMQMQGNANGPLGMNGIAAGCNFLYNFLGQTLEKRDLLTGALITSIAVPGGVNLGNMGLAVDKCGNVYAGSSTGVYIYDPNLTQLNFFATPNSVFDIALCANGDFYAVGANIGASTGFVAQFSSPATCNPVTTAIVNSTCAGGGGSATVNPIFCSPPYSYVWSNGDTTSTADSLGPGTYTVIITGGGACNEVDTMTVSITGGLTVASSTTPASCTSATGTATANPSGGTGPYTYVWNTSPVQTGQTATNLLPGTYIVTVTDSLGCIGTQTITVTQSGSLQANSNFIPPICFGQNNGSATVTPTSGTGPYTYSWNTSPIQITQTATNLAAGTYIVTITDSTGCTNTQTVVVTQPTQVSATATFVPPLCFGDLNGTATATGTGGTGGTYTYYWITSPVQQTQTATGLGAGPYSVIVTDSAGCPSTVNVTVTQPMALTTATTAVPPSVCAGSCTVLSVNAAGGTGAYGYGWNPGAIAGNNPSVCPTGTTTYTVTVTDANGCARIDSVQITILPPPIVSFTADTFQGCAPLCVTFTNTTASTQSAIWYYGDGNAFGANPNYCYPPGIYDVSLIVTALNGCSDTLTQQAYIEAYPSPTAIIVGPPAPVSEWESLICFVDQSTGNVVSWNWNFNDPNDATGSTLQNPCHDYAFTGIYCVDVMVENVNGCQDTAELCVEIYPEASLYIPNAFTPNGAGPNELFLPVGEGITNNNYTFMVFDRWGMLIFETHTWGEGWDGTFHGNPCQQDVYVWKLKCVDVLNKKYNEIGHVSLIR
jgi:gliding motility-associated-like protein